MKAARNGTVLTMELDVQNLNPNAEKKTAKFHSAFLGDYLHDDTTVSRSFAPLSIPGHGTFTETVRFYPMDVGLPYVVDDKGDYRFTLKLVTAKRSVTRLRRTILAPRAAAANIRAHTAGARSPIPVGTARHSGDVQQDVAAGRVDALGTRSRQWIRKRRP